MFQDRSAVGLRGLSVVALSILLGACASARVVPSIDPASLPVCTQWEDARGTLVLPPTCRYEVAPGEWLLVRPDPKPQKRRPWWLLALVLVV